MSLRSMSEIARRAPPQPRRVRDKIERRYANAMGATELAQNSVQGMLEVQQASDANGRSFPLEQIRASMRGDAIPSGVLRPPHPR